MKIITVIALASTALLFGCSEDNKVTEGNTSGKVTALQIDVVKKEAPIVKKSKQELYIEKLQGIATQWITAVGKADFETMEKIGDTRKLNEWRVIFGMEPEGFVNPEQVERIKGFYIKSFEPVFVKHIVVSSPYHPDFHYFVFQDKNTKQYRPVMVMSDKGRSNFEKAKWSNVSLEELGFDIKNSNG